MKDLSPMMEKFCWQYASSESETFNFKAKSAEAAGYKTPANSATDLLKKDKVRARIKEIQDADYARGLSDKLAKLERIFKLSIKANDRTNANTSVKLMLQAEGFLREVTDLTDTEKRELNAEQQVLFDEYLEYRRLKLLKDSSEQSLGEEILQDSLEGDSNGNNDN